MSKKRQPEMSKKRQEQLARRRERDAAYRDALGVTKSGKLPNKMGNTASASGVATAARSPDRPGKTQRPKAGAQS